MQKILVFLAVLMFSISVAFGQGQPGGGSPPPQCPAEDIVMIADNYHNFTKWYTQPEAATDYCILVYQVPSLQPVPEWELGSNNPFCGANTSTPSYCMEMYGPSLDEFGDPVYSPVRPDLDIITTVI